MKGRWAILLAVSASSLPITASAQSSGAAAQPPDPGQGGEIVVTARRREEKLQDVPVAVTVLGGAELQKQNLQSMSEFQRSVPSLTITPSSSRGSSANIMIRGQRQTDNTIFADPSVQTYVNEFNVSRTSGLDTTMFDLESVQVLKGPQGTLFGRNSTGGALLVTTRKPGDAFGGYLRSYVETPIGVGVEGGVDVPLTEGVALRLAGNYQWRRGYTRVVNTRQHLDDRDRWAGRVTLDLKPVDGLRSTFVFEAFESNENGLGTYGFDYVPGGAGSAGVRGAVIAFGYAAAFAQGQALGYHETTSSVLGVSEYKTRSVSNTTTYDIGSGITLKNVAGYRYVHGHDIADQDGTYADVIVNDGVNSAKEYTEELQVQGSSFDDSLEWVAGAYYFHETGLDTVKAYTFKVPLTGSYNNNNFTGKNESVSGFVHFSYTLPFEHRTRIYGGARYTHDSRYVHFRTRAVSATGQVTCAVAGAPADKCDLPSKVSFNEPTWEIGVDHEFAPGMLGYVTVSTGYRAGGFNGRATVPATQVPFDPETVTNYEIGSKNAITIGGARTTLNLAGYYSNYKNIQRTIIINTAPAGATPVVATNIVNAAMARIWGFEAEFNVQINRDVDVFSHYSYTNARYKRFLTFSPTTGQIVDVSFNRFLGVPTNQFGAGINATLLRESFGELSVRTDISFNDKFELNDLNVPRGTSDAATIVNAAINWDRLFGTKMSGSLYAKNLLGEKYIASGLMLTTALDVSVAQKGYPRVVGFQLRVPFGAEN